MTLEVEIVIDKMNRLLNAKYKKDPDFSKRRKNWAFFVSLPKLIELKREAGNFTGVGVLVALMREVNCEILGCKVFGVDGLEDNDIYFAKKLNIKEDK